MPAIDAETEEKPSWADLVEEAGENGTPSSQLPARTEVTEGDKKIVTQYRRDEDGKLQKVVTTYRVETIKVPKDIALRKSWRKFGDCKNDKPGPDTSTTIIGDDVFLTLMTNKENPDNSHDDDPLKKLSTQKIVCCRICKGDHWTTKCPYKDQLENIQQQLKEDEAGQPGTPPSEPDNQPAASSSTGKYVAPGLREGANRRGGDSMQRNQRDETATIRVTNLSVETFESDLQSLFRPFGPISRIFLAKDKVTNASKGFAFINFVHREDAARAIKTLQGFGYDHLILNVEWAKPSSNQN
ncbi:eukaryotic translation initiation factor 3 subunit G [Exaiptasia diaphana]|uniref:Eukaryotic translation initiation factor 3 subunit G n=1 Tax=Exaiptasia diaphana TaxID=2652724 RepID=A0A913WZ44_EXADI|nr:eukaryotic translation initiation factor 3 subunit G [Exaiptasia diaphana]KXJ16639.1 Eukaryotic translation initiation factor 3 subunit G [Exaiptasia diaphana]